METFEDQLDWGVEYHCGNFSEILDPTENPSLYRHIKQFMPYLPVKYAVYMYDDHPAFPKLFNSLGEVEVFMARALKNEGMTIKQINYFKNNMFNLYKIEEI